MFKFEVYGKTYTFLQIVRSSNTTMVYGFDEKGELEGFNADYCGTIKFLDPIITNSPLYQVMEEK